MWTSDGWILIVLFNEVPIHLSHLVRIEEPLVVSIREPLADSPRVDLSADNDTSDVDTFRAVFLSDVYCHPASREPRGGEVDSFTEARTAEVAPIKMTAPLPIQELRRRLPESRGTCHGR